MEPPHVPPYRDVRPVAQRYVAPLAALRRHRGWTEDLAREHLTDPIMVLAAFGPV
jgi:hypothetical protein